MSTSTPHDESILKISHLIDEYIFAGLYRRSANQLEFSLTSLAYMTKVTKKLGPIKVYSFVVGLLFLIAFLRGANANPVKGLIYILISWDSFHISYNSYDRAYASIAGKNKF